MKSESGFLSDGRVPLCPEADIIAADRARALDQQPVSPLRRSSSWGSNPILDRRSDFFGYVFFKMKGNTLVVFAFGP